MTAKPTLRFSAVGLDHPHIYGQVDLLLRAGAEFVSFYAQGPDLIAEFAPRHAPGPQLFSFRTGAPGPDPGSPLRTSQK
jgi:hypothetical protein